MIAVLALLGALLAQDTVGGGVSPRVRDMLSSFPPPRHGEVTIATHFNVATAYVGQQVELVTAAWFPRDVRERLRRQPTLRAPTLSGLWSAPGTEAPRLVDTRRIDGRLYDLFIAHQILFPLGPGEIEAPPAVLSYAVPSSVSFFAPEDRKSLSSEPVSVRILPVPAELRAALGTGPTAAAMRLTWRVANQPIVVGTPLSVELVLSGQGNVTLWPQPEIAWPVGARVYDEPTTESIRRPDGIVSGEKHFSFTVVPDSVGVLTLPEVSYSYFDPTRGEVGLARADRHAVVVQPARAAPVRDGPGLVAGAWVPLATVVIHAAWPGLIVLAVLPLLGVAWRRRPRSLTPTAAVRRDPVDELWRLLGSDGARDPVRVERILRHRGIAADDARAVRDWMTARARHRWARASPPAPPADAVERVVRRLMRIGAVLLLVALAGRPAAVAGQAAPTVADAAARYQAGDAAGAARLFEQLADQHPRAPGLWLNLGLARTAAGDPVGASAAWIRGRRLAPRDGDLRRALAGVNPLPADVRQLAPTIPLSRDEMLLIGLGGWLAGWGLWRRHRRSALLLGGVAVVAAGGAAMRASASRAVTALVRSPTALTVSPAFGAPALEAAPMWSGVRIERRQGDWVLVRLVASESRGWLPIERLAPLVPLD